MISKKLIVISVCVILLFTGCTFGTEEKNAGISDGADIGEIIETAGETTEESVSV